MRAARFAAALVVALAAACGLASTATATPCAGSGYYATASAIQRFSTTTNATTGDPLTAAGVVGAAVSPDGSLLYALDGPGKKVLVIDTATATQTSTVTLGNTPTDVAFAPDGKTAYIANDTAITAIDVASATVTSTLAPGIAVQRVVVSKDGETVYASAADGVHAYSGAVWSTLALPNADALALSRDGKTLYVVGTDTVTPITTATNTLGTTFSAPGAAAVAVSPDGATVYVGTASGAILARTATGTTTIATTATAISELGLRPDGSVLYAATSVGVVALNPAGTVLSTLGSSLINALAICPATVPGAPTAVTVDPGDTIVSVSWTAPANDGGASITGYSVTATPGGATCTTTGATTCTVTGLRNATAYTFVAVARNIAGTSSASTASKRVTPRRDNRARKLTIGTPAVKFSRRSVALLLDVTTTGPGVISLVAKYKKARACAVSKRVEAAGVYRVRCSLMAAARALARRQAASYTLLATFSPTFGPLANARTSVVVPRRR